MSNISSDEAEKLSLPESVETFKELPTNAPDGLQINSRLANRYLIKRELGRGGIGVVYLANDANLLDKQVVVKVLLEKSLRSKRAVQKFRQEIEALTRIEHAGVVGVLDAGETANGEPFLVMQFVDGVNLRSVMMPGEGMSLDFVADLIRQMCDALYAAHSANVLHRDLKPENIMVKSDSNGREQIKLIDFGIARVRNSIVAPTTVASSTDGTLPYMSPEQLHAQRITAASDIYALGVIAYEMITGQRPYKAGTQIQLDDMQRAGVRVLPSDLRPEVSKNAEAVLMKALNYAPEERYQNARTFGEDLYKELCSELDSVSFDTDLSLTKTGLSNAAKPTGTLSGAQTNLISVEEEAETRTHIVPPTDHINRDLDNLRIPLLPPPPKRSSGQIVLASIIGALLIAGAIGATFWYANQRKSDNQNSAVNSPATTPTPIAAEQRVLNYWVDVQKYRGDKPDKAPFRLAGEIVFQNNDHLWLNFESPQSGYLYLVNEGPELTDNLPEYNILFPSPTANKGSSALAANASIRIPGKNGFVIDDERGTEKIWFIWSEKRLEDMETLAKSALTSNPPGSILDKTQIRLLQNLLTKDAANKTEVTKDDERKLTTLKSKEGLLMTMRALEHY